MDQSLTLSITDYVAPRLDAPAQHILSTSYSHAPASFPSSGDQTRIRRWGQQAKSPGNRPNKFPNKFKLPLDAMPTTRSPAILLRRPTGQHIVRPSPPV